MACRSNWDAVTAVNGDSKVKIEWIIEFTKRASAPARDLSCDGKSTSRSQCATGATSLGKTFARAAGNRQDSDGSIGWLDQEQRLPEKIDLKVRFALLGRERYGGLTNCFQLGSRQLSSEWPTLSLLKRDQGVSKRGVSPVKVRVEPVTKLCQTRAGLDHLVRSRSRLPLPSSAGVDSFLVRCHIGPPDSRR